MTETVSPNSEQGSALELAMLADAADRFFQREAPPDVIARWRRQGQVDVEIWRKAGSAGLLGVSIPPEFGGAGGNFEHDVVLVESLVRNDVEGFALQLHNVIVLPYILLHGSSEQKQRWLPKLCTGELIAAIAMSEPGAGSDLQAVRTTARRDGDVYRITGAKTFISNGQIANLIVVVAKTESSAGAKGISLFVVETDLVEGFRRGRTLDKIGLDAQDTSEIFFDDVVVPADNLLGLVEGRGFGQLMAELPRERLLMAVAGVQTMERAIAVTVEYVKQRTVFGQRLFDLQNTQFKLAEARAKATVAKVFVDDCVRRATAGTLDNTTSAVAKMWVTDTEWEVVDECLQLHGGYGYINDYAIAHMFRNSRIQRIYGGSNEIMKMLIARSLA
jgi:acyl-CoA dehydrogenase